MKKMLGFVMVALMTVCLTGCGGSSKNVITCTQTEDDQKITIAATTDKDDKIVKIKMTMDMAASTKEELESSYQIMKLGSEQLNKTDGVKVDVDKKNLNLIMTVDVDLKKAPKDVLKSFNMDEIDSTGAEFKKSAEKNGATCK